MKINSSWTLGGNFWLFTMIQILAWSLIMTSFTYAMDSSDTSVIIHNQGRTLKLPSENSDMVQLIAECEQQLRSADNILRLAVSKKLIRNIKKQEVAIEIQYCKPIRITIPTFNNKTVTFQRILVPITGNLSGDITTIFLGNPKYISGPYRNSQGIQNLAKIIQRLGITLSDSNQ